MKKWLILSTALLLVLFIGACGKKEVEEEPVEEPEEIEVVVDIEEPEEEEPEEVVFPFTAPLTGVGSEEEIDDRIIMVIIENSPDARPQSGLNKADIVYEILAEGNITRFAAFYQSEYPENVGPVRSIRSYLIELGTGYDALLTHAGWSPEAQSIIQKKGLPSINFIEGRTDPYYWRVQFRKAPHNLYTDFTKLKEAAEKFKYRAEGKIPKFSFNAPDTETKGEEATDVTVKYYSGYQVNYAYDEESELYYRSINKDKHTDLLTGDQLTATNILVVKTKHRVLDSEGRLAIDLTSGGEGYLFQKGKVQEIKWKNVDGIIRAFIGDQEPPLYPGKTWINVIPNVNASVEYDKN